MRDHARGLPGRQGRRLHRGLRDAPDREDAGLTTGGFVCLVEIRLHVAGSGSLKAKRQIVRSVKDLLRSRLGAAVAEVDGQDTWQRSTLLCAIVGGAAAELHSRADRLEEIVLSRLPEGAAFERELRSLEDLRG